MSLRLKAIIGIACIEAILLLFLVGTALEYLKDTNNEALIKRAVTTATLFAATSENAVISYDIASLETAVSEILKNPDLVYARVLGLDNIVFVENGSSDYLSKPFILDTDIDHVVDGVYDTYALIEVEGQIYGRVELGLDISSISAVLIEAKQKSIVIALLEMVFVGLFSFLLGAYLTRQLSGLHHSARLIAAGHYDIDLPVKGRDELAEVAKAFNIMAENLRKAGNMRNCYEQGLKQLNKDLEFRVKQRTKELIAKNEELEEANLEIRNTQSSLLHSAKMASLGQLAAGVAHEINNPVAYMMNNLQSLQEYTENYRAAITGYEQALLAIGPQDEKRLQINEMRDEFDLEFLDSDLDDLLTESIGGLYRVRDIVKGLREFSHGNKDEEFVKYDLNCCIRLALKMAENELKYHCEVQTELENLPEVYCNPNQINQVLLNLLVNAGHAIEGEGKITVRSRLDKNLVEISVRDTGKGMIEEQMGKIFDPFYTTKPVGEGTGLGLAISYGVIKDHSGEVFVESELGAGSCFTIKIPRTNT